MQNGSIKLFRLFGIDVFMHWSWFLIAAWLIPYFGGDYFSSLTWSAGLYLLLFGIVLLHEFGHALACKSVGGEVELILLSPLGGAAYMRTPQTPGAFLWSVVAGPLVNVVLVPVTAMAYILVRGGVAWPVAGNDLQMFLGLLFAMNLFLLIYNMLPIYPLDGGQTLVALLWMKLERPKAMRVVGVIGLLTAGAVVVLTAFVGDWILLLLTAYMGWRAWIGYQMGHAMERIDRREYDDRHKEDEVEDRIQTQVDPWRR